MTTSLYRNFEGKQLSADVVQVRAWQNKIARSLISSTLQCSPIVTPGSVPSSGSSLRVLRQDGTLQKSGITGQGFLSYSLC